MILKTQLRLEKLPGASQTNDPFGGSFLRLLLLILAYHIEALFPVSPVPFLIQLSPGKAGNDCLNPWALAPT